MMAGGYVLTPDGRFIPADQAQPDPSIVAAATQPVPDQRLALNVPGGAPDLATIRGMNAQDQAARAVNMAPPGVHGPAPSIADAGGPVDLHDALNRPIPPPPPLPGAPAPGAAPTAPIFASPQASRTGGVPSGAYVVREGRFVPAQQTIQTSTPVSDETNLNLKRAVTDEMAQNTQTGEHQAAAEQGRADILTDTQGGLQQLEENATTAEARRHERMQGAMDRYGQLQREMQSEQIDPKRLFRNTSDAEKFQNSLLLTLGTFGATLAGGENTGMKLFMKRIDDDVAAQNKNLENKQQGIANQRGMVAMMREQFGDERAADATAKMAYIDMAKQRIDAWAASNGSQAALDRAAEANKALSVKWNENLAALERSGTVSRHEVYQPAGVYGGGKPAKEEDVKHLDTELRKEKIPQAYSALDDLEKAIDTSGSGSIEGLGVVGQHVPDLVSSDKAIANRQAVEKAVLAYAHATGRVTPAEVSLVREAALRNGSATALRNWVRSSRTELNNVDRSVRASVPQAASDTYVQRGGLAPRDNSGPTAVTPAGE